MHKCRRHHHKSEQERGNCNLKGRCGVELALGAWKDFEEELKNLKMSKQAGKFLLKLDPESSQKLLEGFHNCKQEMSFRTRQAFSYWDSLPHNILSLGYHLLSGSELDENESRERAQRLLDFYDSCSDKASLGVVSWYFFSKHREDIVNWSINKETMSPRLMSVLIGY